MKKTLAILLTVLLTFGMLSTAALAEDPLKINAMVVQYGQVPEKNSAFWTWMEETFNVDYDVEWVPESGYTDKLSLTLSTGDLPDIINVTNTADSSVVNAANDGLFYDLTDLLADAERFPNLAKLNPSAWTNSKINGRNYFLPRTRGQYNTCLFLRKDILDAAKMDVPHTVSEFEAYFKYIKDNYPDMVPLAYQFFPYMSDYFLGAFGEGQIIPVYTEDGEGIVYETLTESFAKLVEWFQHLYAEGMYASEFALYNTDKNHDMFMAAKTGARHQNAWHRWRLENAVREVVPDAELAMAFYVTSDDGAYVAPQYDIGFYGGHALNADLPEEKVIRILEFFDKTADPEMYNTFRYGLEGIHWNNVDGFAVATEQGAAEVTNSLYGPFVLATNLYDKVDSPLATIEYNKDTREKVLDVDKAAAMMDCAPFKLFSILKSTTWSEFWGMEKPNFDAFVAETIAGRHTIDELRAYQQTILSNETAQQGFREFKANYDEFGLADWNK